MSTVELTEKFLSKIAGWDAIKQARSLLERGQVLSSNWTPPILKGVVQEGSISYRAGLVIKDAIDLENICSCRASRQWGTICAHSVAVGLHHLRPPSPAPAALAPRSSSPQVSHSSPAGPAAPRHRLRLELASSEPNEVPAELHVILPPNLIQAIEKDRIMICFEAGWSGKRQPLNSLPPGQAFALSQQDFELFKAIENLSGGDAPAMLILSSQRFCELLPRLAGSPRITLGRSQPIRVENDPWLPKIRADLQANGELILASSQANAPVLLLSSAGPWVFHNHQFQPALIDPQFAALGSRPVRLTRDQVPDFLNRNWPQWLAKNAATANFKLEDFSFEPAAPRFLLELSGGLAQLHAHLQCAYGAQIRTLGTAGSEKAEAFWIPDPAGPTRYSTRDVAAERASVSRLLRAGFTGPDTIGRYQLLGQNAVVNFFAREFPRLQKEWEVSVDDRLQASTAKNFERIEPRLEITGSGEQWFDLSVQFSSPSNPNFSAADIQRLLLSGQSYSRLPSGKLALLDVDAVEEFQEVLRDCAPDQSQDRRNLPNTLDRTSPPPAFAATISNAHAGFLEATLEERTPWKLHAPSAWQSRTRQQLDISRLESPPLGPLESILRSYQKTGVAWLDFLRQNGFGGVLADEMGLGKTLQTLAFLNALKLLGRASGPSLVICPTSLVFNWAAEAARFVPGLRVLALHGPDRHARFAEIPKSDLVITSYALARRDAAQYASLQFDTVVLDEAQHIKNRQTQNAQAVKSIPCSHRLVLTGTPLENSVLDLWSIFDFLMPGYLSNAKDFKERYEIPIAREKNPEAQARLARRLRPFLLRRLKRDVARELPEKLEQISYCELTPDQMTVYQQLLDATRRELLQAVDPKDLAKSRVLIFTALLRLRQACCDLRLLPLENIDPAKASAKLELFNELLQEAIDGGHRLLLFSQFVKMLHLIRDELLQQEIPFSYLDGSTTDRGKIVAEFQNNPQIPIFLISLKAGGVGLNLTAADTVVHFDPWWNPAVEEQATSRAHRIGQTKVVTSYKLIARGTIEEKILNLQNRKRDLFRGMLGGEEEFAQALSWEEIQDLFSG